MLKLHGHMQDLSVGGLNCIEFGRVACHKIRCLLERSGVCSTNFFKLCSLSQYFDTTLS